MNCQLCGSSDPIEILDLGDQPICNAVLTAQQLTEKEPVYPLKVYVCPKCYLMQLDNKVPKETVFGKNYNYLTGSSPELVKYFDELANRIIQRFNITESDIILDIGCNDGTFLEGFKNATHALLGVEPTQEPAKIAREKGIIIHQHFFENVLFVEPYPKIISAMNVLAHVSDIHKFLDNVKASMSKNSVFVSQSHYLPALVEKLEYDTIYHEHLRYYTLTSICELFRMHGLFVFDAEIVDVYGGSIIVYAKIAKETHSMEERQVMAITTAKIFASEMKYQKLETYIEFANQTRLNAEKLKNYLNKLKAKGKHIIGVGAPMKASTLLNYCKIGTETLDYIDELNPLKIGTYTPGTHIPIIDENTMSFNSPDYALILSWNFTDTIISKWRKRGYKGGFIIPEPEFHVINEVTEITDERGTITDVLTDEQIDHVNHISFKKNSIRGNHYHKNSIHYDYVLKGTLEVYTKFPFEQAKKQVVEKGDLVFTAPNERHALKALEDSEIMVLTRGPRGGKNYEIDTYRLTEEDCLV